MSPHSLDWGVAEPPDCTGFQWKEGSLLSLLYPATMLALPGLKAAANHLGQRIPPTPTKLTRNVGESLSAKGLEGEVEVQTEAQGVLVGSPDLQGWPCWRPCTLDLMCPLKLGPERRIDSDTNLFLRTLFVWNLRHSSHLSRSGHVFASL